MTQAATTLTRAAGNLGTFAGAVEIGTGTLDFSSAGIQVLNGDVSGGGGLSKSGVGTLTLYGFTSYTGTTTLNAGTLNFSNFYSAGDQTLAGAIVGGGALSVSVGGRLTLTGTNTYSGGTTLAGGVLVLGSAGALGSSGAITFAGGSLQYTGANNIDYSGRFAQSASSNYRVDTNGRDVTWAAPLTLGSLTKTGAGTLTLSGTSPTSLGYSGTTALNGGVVALASQRALGSGGAITFAGGSLRYGAFNQIDYSARIAQSASSNYIVDTNAQNVTWATGLASGSVTKSGAGTLTLGGINSYAGATRIDGGELAFTSPNNQTLAGSVSGSRLTQKGVGTLTLSGANGYISVVDISHGTVAFSNSGDQTFGAVVGPGNLFKSGAGTLTLSDFGGHSGPTLISAGTLAVTNEDYQITGTLIQGSGGLTKSGSGTLVLFGNSSNYSGLTTLAGGVLSLGGGGANLGSGALRFAGGTLQYGSGGATGNRTDYSGRIVQSAFSNYSVDVRDEVSWATGLTSGSITKTGNARLYLNGVNSYAGSTTINAGILAFTNGAQQTLTGAVLGSGMLQLSGFLKLYDVGSFAGTLAIDAGTLTLNTTGDQTFAGRITGNFGTLRKEGNGTLTLSGYNGIRIGPTTLAGGVLAMGSADALGSSGSITFEGGVLQYTRANQADYSGRFARSGNYRVDTNGENVTWGFGLVGSLFSVTKYGAGTLTLGGINNYAGTTTIDKGTLAFSSRSFPGITNGDQTIAGTINGQGSLTSAGQGTLTLKGNNTYSGGTTLASGVLALGSAGALGSSGAITFAGGTLRHGFVNLTDYSGRFAQSAGSNYSVDDFGLNVTWATGLVSGSVTKMGAGTLTLAGLNSYAGTTTLNAGALVFSNAGDQTLVGAISGGGTLTKRGAGTLTLRGASTFTGGLNIAEGTVALAGGDDRLPTGMALLMRNGVSLDLGGQSQTLAALGAAGYGVVGNLGAGRLLTSNGVYLQSGRFDATLQGIGPDARLWIGGDTHASVLLNGSNDMVFSPDHNQVIIGYFVTGAAGTVRVGNAQALAAATEGVQVFAGTLDLNGVTGVRARDIALLSGQASALINGDASLAASFAQGINLGAAASSRMGGGGDLSLGGAISGPGGIEKIGAGRLVLTGANSYGGGTALTEGVLSVANDANLGSGRLSFQGGTLSNTGDIITARQATLDGAGGVFNTAGGFLTINGTVGGAGGLVKTGNNILTLNGAQTYTGATTVNAGLLKFAASGAVPSSVSSASFAVAAGARLLFSDTHTVSAPITGAGMLVHEFGGTTTLTGAATHTGGTSVIGGTVQVGSGGSSGALAGNVALSNGGTLAFNRSDALGFAGVISGVGEVVQRGAGVLTLSSVSSFSGTITVQSGEINLSGSVANSAVTVTAGGRLSGNGRVGALTVAGVLAPGNSPGLLTAGAATFASGGSYLWEINDALGSAGVGYDSLAVTGALTVGATLANPFTVTLRSLVADNSAGMVSGFDALHNHRYTLVSTGGGIVGYAPGSFHVDASGFSNALQGGQWSVATSGNGLDLVFAAAAVPEPQSLAMLLAGLTGLAALGRARRRQR